MVEKETTETLVYLILALVFVVAIIIFFMLHLGIKTSVMRTLKWITAIVILLGGILAAL